MSEYQTSHSAASTGTHPFRAGFGDLPPRDTTRWVYRRKAEVVAAVNSGQLSFAEACALYDLSPEELSQWQFAMARNGPQGLRITAPRRRYYGPAQFAS